MIPETVLIVLIIALFTLLIVESISYHKFRTAAHQIDEAFNDVIESITTVNDTLGGYVNRQGDMVMDLLVIKSVLLIYSEALHLTNNPVNTILTEYLHQLAAQPAKADGTE